jgi:hypothetical protein
MNEKIILIAWRLARPLLIRAGRRLRDKWAAELKEKDNEKKPGDSSRCAGV